MEHLDQHIKRHLSLVIAIGFATMSSLGIYHYLQKHESVSIATPGGTVQAGVQTFPVVVVKRDMAPGDKITAEDLDIHQWPSNIVNELYFQSKTQVVGKVLRAGLVANEPLISSKIIGDGDHYGSIIPDNKSAVTITIPRSDMLSRILEEGALVDVLATYDRDDSQDSKVITRGAYILSVEDDKNDKGKKNSRMEVTLLVASRFVTQIIYAMNNGQIQLILSGRHDSVLEIS